MITEHRTSSTYYVAKDANAYDKQRNTTVNEYVKMIYTLSGSPVVDFTASNNKIASNFFNRLNVQRNTYSLGNGVFFREDGTKERLGGDDFDEVMQEAGYNALIHGLTFLFWNGERLYNFDLLEFAPLWDETTGVLRAGIRFWQLDDDRPLFFTIYEEDGYSKWRYSSGADGERIEQMQEKMPYKQIVKTAGGEVLEVVGENFESFPIVPLYGSRLKQSTLVGMKQSIDSFDLIRSGFANDLSDCAQIYWLISGCDGMSTADLQRFRDRLLLNHIALGTDGDAKIEAHTQEIPYQARIEYLSNIRKGLYEDFGAFDTSTISAGQKTATEIRASYQSLDENADDFERQVKKAIKAVLELVGIEDVPTFRRNMIVNESELVNMIVAESAWLDEETILKKLPNIDLSEVEGIMAKKAVEDSNRFVDLGSEDEEVEQ